MGEEFHGERWLGISNSKTKAYENVSTHLLGLRSAPRSKEPPLHDASPQQSILFKIILKPKKNRRTVVFHSLNLQNIDDLIHKENQPLTRGSGSCVRWFLWFAFAHSYARCLCLPNPGRYYYIQSLCRFRSQPSLQGRNESADVWEVKKNKTKIWIAFRSHTDR